MRGKTTALPAFLLCIFLFSGFVFSNQTILSLVERTPESSWPMFRGNLRRTGYSAASPKLDKLWWKLSGTVECSPVVADNKVFIGMNNEIYALDASTGSRIWNCSIEAGLFALAVADGKLFIGSMDKNVYALNATTGAKIWNYTTGWNVYSAPAITGGVVFIGSNDGNIYALNETTGTMIWKFTTGNNSLDSSPAIADGMVFFGSFDSNVYALNATTGTKIWNYKTGYYVEASPAVADGMVFIGSRDSNVYALNETTGAKIWNFSKPTDFFMTGFSSAAVADNIVFVGAGDFKVYALNETNGRKIWEFATGYSLDSSPAVANGVVYIGSHDHNFYALDEMTSKELWKYDAGDEVFFSPAVVEDRVYFAGNQGLYAFGPTSLIDVLIFPGLPIAAIVIIAALLLWVVRKTRRHDIKPVSLNLKPSQSIFIYRYANF